EKCNVIPVREMVAVPNAELAAVPNDQCLWGFPSLQLSPVSPMCWALNTVVVSSRWH
ncbi:Os02g0499000, partial [Oryza sativa Japonica Group]